MIFLSYIFTKQPQTPRFVDKSVIRFWRESQNISLMILLLVPVILRWTFASLKRLKEQETGKVVGEGGATCGERKARYVRFKAKGTDFTIGFFGV